MTQPDPPGRRLASDWYRRLPGWGAGEQSGMAPGQQGPDYSIPEPPRPDEGADLLPHYPGTQAQRAADNRTAVRHGDEWAGDRRLPPYLSLDGIVTYSGTAAFTLVDLGKPSKGYRWAIRQLALLSASKVDDPTPTGTRCNYFIGQIPGAGIYPSMADWAWNLTALAATDFTVTKDFGADAALKVLDAQHLFAILTNGNAGYTYLIKARVEQFPDRGVPLRVQE